MAASRIRQYWSLVLAPVFILIAISPNRQLLWPLLFGLLWVFISLKTVRDGYVRWHLSGAPSRWTTKHYPRNRYPAMFSAYVVGSGAIGLLFIATSLLGLWRSNQLAIWLITSGLILLVPLGQMLDERRNP
ncbi:MAG TPA: hypothetical protein VFW35_10410 [Sphingomicrobium sp.]|nr:hypothetical protein [Sphingomicrobium sp.]